MKIARHCNSSQQTRIQNIFPKTPLLNHAIVFHLHNIITFARSHKLRILPNKCPTRQNMHFCFFKILLQSGQVLRRAFKDSCKISLHIANAIFIQRAATFSCDHLYETTSRVFWRFLCDFALWFANCCQPRSAGTYGNSLFTLITFALRFPSRCQQQRRKP